MLKRNAEVPFVATYRKPALLRWSTWLPAICFVTIGSVSGHTQDAKRFCGKWSVDKFYCNEAGAGNAKDIRGLLDYMLVIPEHGNVRPNLREC